MTSDGVVASDDNSDRVIVDMDINQEIN